MLYGERLGRSFGHDKPPALTTHTRSGFALAVTELRHDAAGFGLSSELPTGDAFLVALHLVAVRRCEVWLDGQLAHAGATAAGDLVICDLQRRAVTGMVGPFHLLAFYIPKGALSEMTGDDRDPRQGEPSFGSTRLPADPTVSSLGQSLRPILASGATRNQLYVDHALIALCSHLAVACSNAASLHESRRVGLAPWQKHRALDLLQEHLADGVRLDALSQACSLSSSAFQRAFRRTMGLAPHQWLIAQRLARARELIRDSGLPLSEIALDSGFADQSHLTRAFSRRMGISPGKWRRSVAPAPHGPAADIRAPE